MNTWITHVKKYAKKHNIGYNEALRSKKCQMEYRKTSPRGMKTSPRGRKTSPRGRKTSPRGRKTSPRGRKKMNGILGRLYKKLRRNQGNNTNKVKLTKKEKKEIKRQAKEEIDEMNLNLVNHGYAETNEGMIKKSEEMAKEEISKLTAKELDAALEALMKDETI